MAYEDLLKDTSKVDPSNRDYFLVTITDLDVNQSYPIQFRWKFDDGTFSPWSTIRVITTPGESEPNTPNFTTANVDTTEPGFIKITWDGMGDDASPMVNIDRVDIYISGAPFDGTKPTDSFKTAGTKLIAAPGGTYQIALYAVSKLGKLSPVSAAVTKTVIDPATPSVDAEDPEAPTVTAGLASVIVEWSGKKFDGQNFPEGSFSGAKVFVGTSAGFMPSNDNWVHTLNFANGSNKVAIGVGTIIDKSNNTKLAYGTPYYIKIDTINPAGVANGNPISASGNPITVNKVAASEIKTGFLSADGTILAGTDGGARVELSAGASPLVIYGTNGTTKLLEFIGGSTGTLSINGGGTFTGNLSAGSGNSIFKSDTSGIYLGNASYSSAPFSVSRNGIIKAEAGTIGGWTLGSTYLQNSGSTPTIKIDTSGIVVGSTSNAYIDITSGGITHRNANGSASGKFTLTTGSSASLSISGTFAIDTSSTIAGTSASTVVSGASSGSTAVQGGNGVSKNIYNQVSSILMNSGGIQISTATSGTRMQLSNAGLELYNGSTRTVHLDSYTGNATFTGTVSGSTITGGNINITGETFSSTYNDTEGAAGDVGSSNSMTSTYYRNGVLTMGFNAVSLISANTAGVVTSWYPYTDGAVDLGIKQGSTYSTYRWRNLRLTGDAYFGGDGSTNTVSPTNDSNGTGAKTKIYSSGLIYANTLGVSTGTTIVQNSSGYLKVSSSSRRYKENISPISGTYLDAIMELNPVTFSYKEEFSGTSDNPTVAGLIAEDVNEIDKIKGVVNYNIDGQPESISYDRLSVFLAISIKELSNKIDLLSQRLDALEA